jgi:hypothetical protein
MVTLFEIPFMLKKKMPLAVYAKTSNVSNKEQKYYKLFYGKRMQHNAIVTSVEEGKVKFLIMSSQPVNRKNDLKLGDINSDVILYRMPINEFFKLIYNDPTSNVTFEDRLLVKDSFEKLNNQFVNVCHVEASLEDELAPFKNIKKIKDRDELVKKYFKSKN